MTLGELIGLAEEQAEDYSEFLIITKRSDFIKAEFNVKEGVVLITEDESIRR